MQFVYVLFNPFTGEFFLNILGFAFFNKSVRQKST